MNLPDIKLKTFAERFFLGGAFQVIIQRLVYFAVGYKDTKWSKVVKNFPQYFFITLSAKFTSELFFHACVFLKTLMLRAL